MSAGRVCVLRFYVCEETGGDKGGVICVMYEGGRRVQFMCVSWCVSREERGCCRVENERW